MIFVSMIAFILAAMFGLFMLFYVLGGNRPPRMLSLTHGTFAVIGLVLLLVSAFYISEFRIAAIIILLAALGGIYMFSFDLRQLQIPKKVAVIHGLAAITGFLVLMFAIFSYFKLAH